jgi:hypothetical protein
LDRTAVIGPLFWLLGFQARFFKARPLPGRQPHSRLAEILSSAYALPNVIARCLYSRLLKNQLRLSAMEEAPREQEA